jgi:hypothetical protein
VRPGNPLLEAGSGYELLSQIFLACKISALGEKLNPMQLASKQLNDVGWERAVSSVVEHYLDTVGVAGSIPASRTIFVFADLHGVML